MMESEKLNKCIQILFDMELNNYFMETSIKEITLELEKEKQIHPPKLYTPDKPTLLRKILGNPITDFFEDELDFASGILGKLVALVLMIITFPIGIIIGIIIYLYENKKYDNRILESRKEYDKKILNYNVECENKKLRADRLIQQKEEFIKRHYEATEKLKLFYDEINVPDKFRGLIPVSYMKEFLDLGITNKLEGVDGLYFLVRKELADKEFSAKIDDLINSQYALRNDLTGLQRRFDVLNLRANSQMNSSSPANYHLERIEKELEYQNYMFKKTMYN